MRKIYEAVPIHSRHHAEGTGNGHYGICGGKVSNPLLARTIEHTPDNEARLRGITA